ncbi:hypothetical protein [Phyllobacterium sp. OV277]|uniref:hypothetical protein n=1 Tax=Phyllobacterium sp. OV277 TaxID=1882772 RepID=UPI0015879310|nr:hypothetical protein [Phyllobacterium sp. OV277]
MKILFKPSTPERGVAYGAVSDQDGRLLLKSEEISADFLSSEERNHTTDDRDPSQRWEE